MGKKCDLSYRNLRKPSEGTEWGRGVELKKKNWRCEN